MAFNDFLVDTVDVEHIVGVDAWATPSVSTFSLVGRLEESLLLRDLATTPSVDAVALLFTAPNPGIEQGDFVTIGGVRYKVLSVDPMKRQNSTHHCEIMLGAGKE